MWDLMLPECFNCFTIVSSEWEQVIGGAGFVEAGGIYVCDGERKGGAAREGESRACSVCVNVFGCNLVYFFIGTIYTAAAWPLCKTDASCLRKGFFTLRKFAPAVESLPYLHLTTCSV